MNKKVVWGIIVVLILVVIVSSSNDDGSQPSIVIDEQQAQEDTEISNEVPGESDGSIREFIVTGTPFQFSMDEIRVAQGDTVRIVFKNEKGTHDWKIDEFNASTNVIKTGEEDTIEFVVDKAGEFEYYCSVGDHRERGMKGTLIVTTNES